MAPKKKTVPDLYSYFNYSSSPGAQGVLKGRMLTTKRDVSDRNIVPRSGVPRRVNPAEVGVRSGAKGAAGRVMASKPAAPKKKHSGGSSGYGVGDFFHDVGRAIPSFPDDKKANSRMKYEHDRALGRNPKKPSHYHS